MTRDQDGKQLLNEIRECIEIYVPKNLRVTSALYEFLVGRLESDPAFSESLGEPTITGFSLYEADGAFRGQNRIYEERTIIVRLLIIRAQKLSDGNFESQIKTLARNIAKDVLNSEEEVLVSHYSQQVKLLRM